MLLKDILIDENSSIKDALKKIDRAEEKVLLAVDGYSRLIGTITDGDIRRYILSGKRLDGSIKGVCNRNPIVLPEKAYSVKKAKTILEVRGLKLIPIVDTNKKVVNFISQSSLLSINVPAKNVKRIDMAVIIMAGGKSTRLEPFSKIFPKPLIPIGDKPIIDRIIDEFRKNGINRYYLTLNYKGDMIESYFNHMKKDYHVSFLREKGYYGTAGSLKLFHKYTDDTFIVSNCDVIIKADFEDVIKFHNKQESDLTILSSMQHYKIPYGVINFKKGGEVINLTEKPEYTFAVNAGVYILRRKILRFIPSHKRFDMTDLIKVLIDSRKRVFTYPVNENEYIDIGQWDEYKKAMGKIL